MTFASLWAVLWTVAFGVLGWTDLVYGPIRDTYGSLEIRLILFISETVLRHSPLLVLAFLPVFLVHRLALKKAKI